MVYCVGTLLEAWHPVRALPNATAPLLPPSPNPDLPPLPRATLPASPGEVAFDSVRALSTCMPGRLGAGAATTLTACLRLVSQAQAGRGLSYAEVATRPAVASVVHALASVTAAVGQQLPPSSYCYVFPVLQVGAAWCLVSFTHCV